MHSECIAFLNAKDRVKNVKIKTACTTAAAMGDARVYARAPQAAAAALPMETAGYKPKLEKWDSDSDSDETDEEDLKV